MSFQTPRSDITCSRIQMKLLPRSSMCYQQNRIESSANVLSDHFNNERVVPCRSHQDDDDSFSSNESECMSTSCFGADAVLETPIPSSSSYSSHPNQPMMRSCPLLTLASRVPLNVIFLTLPSQTSHSLALPDF